MRSAERPEALSEPDLKKRTKAFALRVLKLVDALPKTTAGRVFWLELLEESELVTAAKLAAIKQEANELIAITVASIKTARQKRAPDSEFRIPHSALV